MILARFAPVLSSICACFGSGRMRMSQLEMYALMGTQEIGGEERNRATLGCILIFVHRALNCLFL
jgi:hypothetical protein